MKDTASQRRRPTKKRVTVNGRRLALGLQTPVWTALEKEAEATGDRCFDHPGRHRDGREAGRIIR